MSLFPVIHSILDPQALLREVSTYYDIGSPVTCVLLRSWINEVYRVQTSHGRFILKVFRHGWRAPEEVAYEIELMQHLAACGIRVEPPVFTRARTTFCQVPAPEGQRSIVLYPMLEGQPPLPPSESIYHRVGQALAHMHNALDTFVPTHPRRALDIHFLAEEPLAWLQPYLESRQNDWDFLASLVQQIRTQLEILEQTGELSQGAIHGDATLDNLLITDDGRIGMYDFDQSGPGWRAYDLQGVFYWAWEIKRPSFWTALLEGYQSVLPLGTVDMAAMPYFPVLHRLWCMGFEAHVITQNHGQWIVNSEYFDNKLIALRQWTAVYSQLRTNP